MALPVWATFIGVAAVEEALVNVADRYIGKRVSAGRRSLVLFGLGQVQNVASIARLSQSYKDKPLELLSSTLSALMKPVERGVRRNTPVDEGKQRESVETRVTITPSKLGKGTYIVARTGWLGPTRRPRVVGAVIEYGSRRGRKAKQVVRNSVSSQAMNIRNAMSRVIPDQVNAVVEAEMKDSIRNKVFGGQQIFGLATALPTHYRTVKGLAGKYFKTVGAG